MAEILEADRLFFDRQLTAWSHLTRREPVYDADGIVRNHVLVCACGYRSEPSYRDDLGITCPRAEQGR